MCTAQLLFQLLCLDSYEGNVRCTDVDEQLGQLEAREAQLHLPTHDLFWANLKVQLHLPPLRSLDLLISPGRSRPVSPVFFGWFLRSSLSLSRPLPTLIPSLIGHLASVDVKQHKPSRRVIVQELCESRGGRPGLSVLTSLLVSVDVKNY